MECLHSFLKSRSEDHLFILQSTADKVTFPENIIWSSPTPYPTLLYSLGHLWKVVALSKSGWEELKSRN